jgi:hypothetical protein
MRGFRSNSSILAGITSLPVLTGFAVSIPAQAEMLSFKADLVGASEVPPTTSKGAGTADLTYDTATKKLSYKVTYTGLTGPATMGHIHGPAAVGKNAPVAIPFANPTSPIDGSATLTAGQEADLLAGMMYVNVHTADNKGGEIRGQVVKK